MNPEQIQSLEVLLLAMLPVALLWWLWVRMLRWWSVLIRPEPCEVPDGRGAAGAASSVPIAPWPRGGWRWCSTWSTGRG